MLAGTLVVSHISSQWATWTAMIALLAIHLGTNYLAVRAVSMRTLNRQRANLLFSDYLERIPKHDLHSKINHLSEHRVLSPEEISAKERIFERDGVLRWKGEVLGYCRLGVDLRTVLNHLGPADRTTGSYNAGMVKLMNMYKDEDYILWYDLTSRTYLVVLKDSSTTITQLKAWMHALYSAKQGGPIEETLFDFLGITLRDVTESILDIGLVRKLEDVGWDVSTGAMETRPGTRLKIKARRTEGLKTQTQGRG